jgi:hypothetical protein
LWLGVRNRTLEGRDSYPSRLARIKGGQLRSQHGHKGGTAIAVKKRIPHTYADLPLLVSVEATRICIPIGHTEMLLASL